jgi:hypothetical protein
MWFVSTGSSGAVYVVSAYRPVKWIALAWDANLASRLATFELIQLDKVPQNCASRTTDCKKKKKKTKSICRVYIGQLNLDYLVVYELLTQYDVNK